MDTYSAILQSLPKTAFKLNSGGTAYVDLTNRGVTLSSTPSLTAPGLVSGSTKSALITSGTSYNFPTSVFVRSQEYRGFSLECTVLTTDRITGFISVMSHNGVEDGLYIKDNEIRFTVEFNTLGTVTAAFPIPLDNESYTVQAVYNVAAISLFVDGYLYDSAEISEAQRVDGFKARASNNLYIGQGTATGKKIAVDGMAVYGRSLTDSEAYLHNMATEYVVPHQEIASVFGGVMSVDGGEQSRNIILHRVLQPNWDDNAVFNDTAVQDDRLVPEVDYLTQESKPGTWLSTFNVDGWPTTYNIVVRWEGGGLFTVEASLNGGTSWSAVTSGTPITGTYGVATTSVKPVVRVIFTGGVLDDESHLTELSVTAYGDSLIYTTDATRPITASATALTWDKDFEPIQRGNRHGLSLTNSITIPADTGSVDPQTFQTLEGWVKWDAATASQYAYDLRPGVANGYLWISGANLAWATGTVYINGLSASSGTVAAQASRWVHITHVLSAPVNVAVILGTQTSGRITFGAFNLHPSAFTAAQALAAFNAYHSYPTARVATESNPVSEGPSAYNIYQSDWSLIQTGM